MLLSLNKKTTNTLKNRWRRTRMTRIQMGSMAKEPLRRIDTRVYHQIKYKIMDK